jgi:phosphonate transport system ATP-binding protein
MGLMRDVGREHRLPVIVNMHDVELARRFAGRIVGMSGGKVVYDGDGAGLGDTVLKSIYGGESWLG